MASKSLKEGGPRDEKNFRYKLSYVLLKKNRLAKKNDFDAVFAKGKSMKGDFLIVKFLKNNLSDTRAGFVISKKVSPKATVRNKVRRRLRAVVEKILKEKSSSVDVVIVALPGIEKRNFSEIEHSINLLFNKI